MKKIIVMLIVVCCAGCGAPELTDAEKWWQTPPASARYIAFENNGKWGYKDRTGKVIVSPRFEYAVSFPREGNIVVAASGKVAHIMVPSKPLGRVQVGRKWGYADASGRLVIPATFDAAQDFFENLTAVKVGSRWGFIDTSGTMVIPPHYDDASPFLLNVAHVVVGNRWQTIGPDGKNTGSN